MAKLGEMLVSEGLITPQQLEEALKIQRRLGCALGQAIVQKGILTEDQVVAVLSRQTGYPKFEQDPERVDPNLASVVPERIARKFSCAPLMVTGNVLSVASLDPENESAVDSLATLTGRTIKMMVIGQNAMEAVWKRLYGRSDLSADAGGSRAALEPAKSSAAFKPGRDAKAPGKPLRDPTPDELKDSVAKAAEQIPEETNEAKEDLPLLALDPVEPPQIRIVNGLLLEALKMRASDIHIEPYPEGGRVRIRVDGELHTTHELPVKVMAGLTSRLKVLAGLDIAEKRFPQDGRIKFRLLDGKAMDFRISTLPGIYGEKVVMRALGTGQLRKSVEELGFRGRALQYVHEALRNPFGMVLVTGPTGSGKTTTLYTMLNELSDPSLNIVTAEDPVEYNLPNITQVSVKPQIGFTFDVALRSFLRQDPDIILVGEMRDFETAAIAVKAALTGHLVFSTVHTNDAPSTVVRLVDMGIEPYLVASAVKLVIAQRLVRRICENCKDEVDISPEEQDNLHESTLATLEKTWRGKGCDKCGKTGYFGRVPVYEVMPIKSKDLKRVITEGGSEVLVAQVARREGVRTLKDEAIDLVNEGVTSLEEGLQIIVSD